MPAPGAAYVVIDVETTGLIPGEDHVYEIAMSAFDDEGIELARFESLICPAMAKLSKRLSPVAAAPTFEAIAGTVCDWLRIAPVVGHNVTFDLAMIDGELARFGAGLPEVPYIDTLALAEQVGLGSSDLRLSTLIPHLGITGADFHTAMADVWAANQLLICLRAALSGTAGLVPLPTPATFHGRSRGPWPDLPGRAAPLPRDPATFPAAVRRPDKHEPGLHGTIFTISTADFTVPPDLQRQIDERTIEVARQGVAAIVPGAQLPERIAALLGPIGSTDFEEALDASTEFIDWARDPSGELHAAEADWAARGFSGTDGIARLTRIVELFAGSGSVDLPEVALTLARLKRTEPTCAADEVEAAYRVAFEYAWADDREFNASSAELDSSSGVDPDEADDEDDEDDVEFEQAEQVLDEWLAFLRGIGDQERMDHFLVEFSDPVWGYST